MRRPSVSPAGFDGSKGPGLWQKFKDKYGEEDKLSNFFAGDHSRRPSGSATSSGSSS